MPLQKNAALGRDLTNTPLHLCQCPNCFTSFATANGIECVPKCDLASCDEDTGVCNAEGGTGIKMLHTLLLLLLLASSPCLYPPIHWPLLLSLHLSALVAYSSHKVHFVMWLLSCIAAVSTVQMVCCGML